MLQIIVWCSNGCDYEQYKFITKVLVKENDQIYKVTWKFAGTDDWLIAYIHSIWGFYIDLV